MGAPALLGHFAATALPLCCHFRFESELHDPFQRTSGSLRSGLFRSNELYNGPKVVLVVMIASRRKEGKQAEEVGSRGSAQGSESFWKRCLECELVRTIFVRRMRTLPIPSTISTEGFKLACVMQLSSSSPFFGEGESQAADAGREWYYRCRCAENNVLTTNCRRLHGEACRGRSGAFSLTTRLFNHWTHSGAVVHETSTLRYFCYRIRP